MSAKREELLARLAQMKQTLLDKLAGTSQRNLALSLVNKYQARGSILWRVQAAVAMCVLSPGLVLGNAKIVISEMSN